MRRTFFNPPEAAADCAMPFNILHAQDPVATPGRPYRFAPPIITVSLLRSDEV